MSAAPSLGPSPVKVMVLQGSLAWAPQHHYDPALQRPQPEIAQIRIPAPRFPLQPEPSDPEAAEKTPPNLAQDPPD